MEREAEQLKLNALNIKSVLTSGSKKLKKITYKKRNLDRISGERKERRAKEKILESSRRTVKNIGSSFKNMTSAVVGAVASGKGAPGKFLQLLLIGIAVNNIENIVKFFKGDTFKKLIGGLKKIGEFFKGMFNGFIGFFKPKNEIEIPKELNDSNAEKLKEVNKELEGIKTETDKLNELSKSAKEKYDKFENKVTDKNQDVESNIKTLRLSDPQINQNLSPMSKNLFDNNSFSTNTFAESMNMNLSSSDNNINIKPVEREKSKLNMSRKKNIKTVFIRQPVIVGEK